MPSDELSEDQQVAAWEFLMLLDLGFTVQQGLKLVAIPHFSWHDAERLVKKGMPLELVIDQLTP